MATNAAPIVDLGRWQRPMRRIKLPDGTIVIERPPAGRSLKAVNMAGSVVWIRLSNGMANRAPNDAYGLQKEYEKIQKGFVPYSRCPQTLIGIIPAHLLPSAILGRPPCTAGRGGLKLGSIDEETNQEVCCKCIEELIAIRTAQHSALQEKREARTGAERQSDQMAQVIGKLTDLVAAQSPTPSKPAPTASSKRGGGE